MSRRREKFIELAEKRVIRSVRDLRLIGNLANRNNYEYTESDVRQILAALSEELQGLKRRFKNGGTNREVNFKLRSPKEA